MVIWPLQDPPFGIIGKPIENLVKTKGTGKNIQNITDASKRSIRKHKKSQGFMIFTENLGKTIKNECLQHCFPLVKVTVIHAPVVGGPGVHGYAE